MWKGAVAGLVIGAMLLAVTPLMWFSPWAIPCAGAAAVALTLFGLVVGRAVDTRDSLRDLIR